MYERTQASTLNKLKARFTCNVNSKPKQLYNKGLEDVGDLDKLSALGQAPRDRKQKKNLKQKQKKYKCTSSSDDLVNLMDMIASESGGNLYRNLV